MRQTVHLVPITRSFDQSGRGIPTIVAISHEGHHITPLTCSCHATDPLVVHICTLMLSIMRLIFERNGISTL